MPHHRHALLALLFFTCAAPAGAQDEPVTALVGGTIIDGSGAAPITNGTLLLRGDTILDVGPAAEIDVPAGAARVDVTGRTLMPGLINSHGHVAGDSVDKLETYARYGVTTVLSLGGEDASHVRLREEQDEHPERSRLLVAGPIPTPDTKARAREAVAELVALDVDWVKVRVQGGNMAEDIYATLIDEAHAAGLPFAAHMYDLADTRSLVRHGVDMLAHSVRDAEMDAALLEDIVARGICLSPTLMREVSTYVYADRPDFFDDPFFLMAVTREELAPLQAERARSQARAAEARGRADLDLAMHNLRLAHEAGVRIAMGTDSGAFLGRFPGYFEHEELVLMVAAGMAPAAVIHAATGAAADCIGVGEKTGTLASGMRADFLVLGSNPLEDIRNTRDIEAVWINGRPIP